MRLRNNSRKHTKKHRSRRGGGGNTSKVKRSSSRFTVAPPGKPLKEVKLPKGPVKRTMSPVQKNKLTNQFKNRFIEVTNSKHNVSSVMGSGRSSRK